MTYRINFTTTGLHGDHEDSIVIQGESIEDIRLQAQAELAKRGGKDAWSEELG